MKKVKTKPFPRLLHITLEDDDEPFFIVQEKGVLAVEEAGKAIAIYELVSVGTVEISKTFVETL